MRLPRVQKKHSEMKHESRQTESFMEPLLEREWGNDI